jgi:hypothetical protein
LPELRTLFTIPPRVTRLHNLLQSLPIRGLLLGLSTSGNAPNEQAFRNAISLAANSGMIPSLSANEIQSNDWLDIQSAITDISTPILTSYDDLLLEEFAALRSASVNGAPPAQSSMPRSRSVFHIDRNDVKTVTGPNGRLLRITPIARLRTVSVQVGYRREVPRRAGNQPARIVDIRFEDSANQAWYPGAEYLGEGIFITLDGDGNHFPMAGDAAVEWSNAVQGVYDAFLFRSARRAELDPVFVWWHTLSHLLIRSLSIDAGYSSSAIRERVFLELDTASGTRRGGVVLYATQPGSDGTLGGLLALVPRFQDILDRALEMGDNCSNDPLCSDNRFRRGGYSGSSCYSCCLISETSCEHRNLWLDREVLRENQP